MALLEALETRKNTPNEVIEMDNNVIPINDGILREENSGRFVKGTCPARSPGRKPMPQEFKNLAIAHSMEALEVTIDIMNNPKERTQNRLKAVEIILSRAYGLATVSVSGGVGEDGEEQPISIEHLVRLCGGSK